MNNKKGGDKGEKGASAADEEGETQNNFMDS